MSTAELPSPTVDLSLLDEGQRADPGIQALKHALLTSLPLALVDMLTVAVGVFVSQHTVSLLGLGGMSGMISLLPILGVQILIMISAGLYPGVGLNPIIELRLLSWSTALTFGVCIVAAQLSHALPAGTLLVLLLACCIILVVLPLARNVVRSLCANYSWWGQRVLIFGSGPAALTAYQHLLENKAQGLRPVGLVDDAALSQKVLDADCYLGTTHSADELAAQHEITWAMLVMPERTQQEIMQVVKRHSSRFPHMFVAANMAGLPFLWNSGHECAGLAGLRVNERLLLPGPRIMKRFMDLGLIVLVLPVLLPLFAMIAVLIKRNSAGSIFYRQKRIGRDGQAFWTWKFRTMIPNADLVLAEYLAAHPAAHDEWNRDHKLRDDPRVTRIGSFCARQASTSCHSFGMCCAER